MWFDGPITDAVAKTKTEKTLLIVFVYGVDEKSLKMKENFESEKIRNICEGKNCIALKLEENSEAAKQFASVYPLLCVPCSYFIGTNGRTLDIFSDGTVESLEEKLLKSLGLHEAAKSPGDMPSTSNNNVARSAPSDGQNQSTGNTLEARIAKAQQLLKEDRERKAKQYEEDAKAKEIKRRQEGKGVNEAREKLREQEILAAAEERKKDKIADKAHLQKLRDQIAADRAEKSKVFENKKDEDNAKKVQQKEELEKKSLEEIEQQRLAQLERCKFARIQFRLPAGSAVNHIFEADLPFLEAVKFAEGLDEISSQLHLVQMFPRREFTAEDLNKSFKELDLVPSAVLMVLPDSKVRWNSLSNQKEKGWYDWAVSMVSVPFSWIYSFIFGPPRGVQQAVSGPNKTSTEPKNKPETKPFRSMQGNIRRMPNADDDDNATWNGNSTQQL